MPGNHPIVQNSHRLFSQITHSLMNTACPLLMLSPMIKNVWIAAEIEENVFVQYKNLPFLKPAETQAKRITKLVSHPTWLGLFPLPNSQKPITTQTWGYFTSQPRHDFCLTHPTHTHWAEFSAAFLKCSRITFPVIQWTRSGNWCSWKQTCFPTGCFQMACSLCSTVDAWGRWKK